MIKFSMKKLIVLGTIITITGFAAYAFAHGGGYHMGGGYGMMNDHHMGYSGGHMWNSLSAEDQKTMQDQMDKFYSSTKGLREQYDQKRSDLSQEYSKPEKDQAMIETLEKELFDLSSKLDKERFNHMSGMRKLFAGKTNSYNYGRGRYGGCF